MHLYLISQSVNADYDTFDSAVVAAESAEEARKIHPSVGWDYENHGPVSEWWNSKPSRLNCWANRLEEVTVDYLGYSDHITEAGVILASYNAG